PVEPTPPIEAAPEATVPATEEIAPPEGRLERLRERLARSPNALGGSLLGLIGGGDLDEDPWEEVEATRLVAERRPRAHRHQFGRRSTAQQAGQPGRAHRGRRPCGAARGADRRAAAGVGPF